MSHNCATYQSYTLGCGDVQGGNRRFYITDWANITTAGGGAVTSASGTISAITIPSGKFLYTYEQEIEVSSTEDNPTPDPQKGTFYNEQTVFMRLFKRQASLAYQLRATGQIRLAIISEEQSGKRFLFGEVNGMRMVPSKSGSGTAMGDTNGYDITFKGKEPHEAQEISDACWSTLVGANKIV